MRPLSACFWSWCNPGFSFGFCHSNLGLGPRVLSASWLLSTCLAETTYPFIPCYLASSCHKEVFPKADGRHFTQDEQLFVLCFAIESLYCSPRQIWWSSSEQLERMWTWGISYLATPLVAIMALIKFCGSLFFFLIYSLLQKVFLPLIFICNKISVLKQELLMCKIVENTCQTLPTHYR